MVLVLRLRDTSAVALLVALTLLWNQFGKESLRLTAECAQPLLLDTAHKTGTMLAKQLAAAVNVQLGLSCRAALQVDYNCPPDIGAPRAEHLRLRRRRLDDEGVTPCATVGVALGDPAVLRLQVDEAHGGDGDVGECVREQEREGVLRRGRGEVATLSAAGVAPARFEWIFESARRRWCGERARARPKRCQPAPCAVGSL